MYNSSRKALSGVDICNSSPFCSMVLIPTSVENREVLKKPFWVLVGF